MEALRFAFYNCNCTEMDVKSRNLVLLAMIINNTNCLNLKYTNNKVINLELYSNVRITQDFYFDPNFNLL